MGLLTVVVTTWLVGFPSGEPRMDTSSFTATTGSSVTRLLLAEGDITSFSVLLSIPGNGCSLKSTGTASTEELVDSPGILQVRDWSVRGPAKKTNKKILSLASLDACQ